MQCNAQTLVFICIYLYVNLRVVGTDGGPVVVSDGGPVVVSDGGPVEVVSDGTGVFALEKKQHPHMQSHTLTYVRTLKIL